MKKIYLIVVALFSLVVLMACGNSADNDISGTWLANHSFGELELVVDESEFELNLNYVKSGWFSSSDETMTLMRGQVKPGSKALVVESITPEMQTILEVDGSEEVNLEELKMTYKRSGTILTLDMGGELIEFNKKVKKESAE